MMFFLSLNVVRDLHEFIHAHREDAVTFLPMKFELGMDLFVYTKRSRAFDLSDKFGNQYCRRQPAEQVRMITHRIVADRPAAARLDFFDDDFKKFGPPSAINQWFA